MKNAILVPILGLVLAIPAYAGIIISEVDPSGSATSPYNADWFELTNTGAGSVDITGWKIDDNSHAFANAVALRGITSIPAGKSVVFIEGDATGTTDATVQANFIGAWFGGTAPLGFLIGGYGGTGVGLSQTADEVNIYDSGGTRITGVGFAGASLGITLDNAAGAGGTTDPVPAISTASVAGVNGAFLSGNNETGSPGLVPEPASIGALLMAGLLFASRRSRA